MGVVLQAGWRPQRARVYNGCVWGDRAAMATGAGRAEMVARSAD